MATLFESPLPRTRAYVEALPEGLDSYPQTLLKGSACGAILQNLPEIDLAVIPDELRGMLENPPPVSVWIPEIPVAALIHTLCESHFTDDEAFLAWAEAGFANYFGSALYRILFAVLSPVRLARGADKKWGALRQGSRREMIEATETYNRGRIVYPPHAFSRLYVEMLCRGFVAAYRLSRAKNPAVRLLSWSPTESTLEIVYDVDARPT